MQGSDKDSGDHDEIRKAFDKVVNMTPKSLEEWLQTEKASQSAGSMTGTPKQSGTKPVGRLLKSSRRRSQS